MRNILLIVSLISCFNVHAQNTNGYQTPPKAIADLLLAKPTPSVSIDKKANWMLIMERNSYPTVEEL